MYQHWFTHRNHPHHTMFARLYQCFEKMGLFVPGALVEDRVERGHLRLKKCLRELATTSQLAHVPLPMPWVQISLQWCESCKNKTSRKYKVWGPTTSHLMFDLSVVFATEHRESCLSCTSLVYWWGLLHKRWLPAETATFGTTRIHTQCSYDFTRRDSM